jgi:tetratricopeptide (TPR) repeat protein
VTEPWAKLAAVYHIIGDQQALDKLLKHHPAAAAGIGDLNAAVKDWDRAIAEYGKVITDQPADGNLLTKLFTIYQSAGRTREGIPYLAMTSAAKPDDTMLLLKVAALQAWFGQDKEHAVTARRGLELAKNSAALEVAERVAKACCFLRSSDQAQIGAALALAHKAVDLGGNNLFLPYFKMALGMAEYRSGHLAEAEAAFLDAAERGQNSPHVTGTSAFYRALCLFRQGKKAEAGKLAIEAAAKMKPLPKDEKNPLAGNANYDDLIMWLAYKEAKAMIKFDDAPPPKGENNKK